MHSLLSMPNVTFFLKYITDEELLEIAWEVIDAARVLYEKFPGHERQLADVHLRLAEVQGKPKFNALFEHSHLLIIKMPPQRRLITL